jgi:hypothetical protein
MDEYGIGLAAVGATTRDAGTAALEVNKVTEQFYFPFSDIRHDRFETQSTTIQCNSVLVRMGGSGQVVTKE